MVKTKCLYDPVEESDGDHVCWMLCIKYEVAFLWFNRVRQKVTNHFHSGEREVYCAGFRAIHI